MSLDVNTLYEAGAHIGYSRSRRHPSVHPYLFGVRSNIDLINLEETTRQLDEAIEFLKSVIADGKKILFVGTKAEAKRFMIDAADTLDMPYVDKRWIGGTLTNAREIGGRVKLLAELESKQETDSLTYRTKKELLMLVRKIKKLQANFGGLKGFTGKPGCVFVIDSRREHIAVSEANTLGIPVVSISSTDCDISDIDYPVVANDAGRKSLETIIEYIATNLRA